MIHVKIIKPNKKDLRPFIQLPFDIYKNDKNWAPPNRQDLLRSLTGKDNEFLPVASSVTFWHMMMKRRSRGYWPE